MRKANASETKTEMHTTKQRRMDKRRKQKWRLPPNQISEKNPFIPSLSAGRLTNDHPRNTPAEIPRRRRRKTQQLGTKTNNNEGRTDLLIQEDVEYADDTQL